MNWIIRLVSESGSEASAKDHKPAVPEATPPAPPARPPVDIGRLREILAAAPTQEREVHERELGCALGEARATPLASDPKPVWIEAACAVTDRSLALEWLATIDDEASLARVARHARIAELRLEAAKRIADTAELERIADAMRHRDKRVYRHCVEILRERRRAAARAERLARIAGALRTLLETQPLAVDRLAEYEKELRELTAEGPVPQECLDLALAARNRATTDSQTLRDLGNDAAEAEALCAEIAATGKRGIASALRLRIEALAARPARHVTRLADHPTAAALAHSIERARSLVEALTTDEDAIVACTRFIEANANAEAGLEALDAGWDTLPKPRNPAIRHSLQSRWAALRQRLAAARTAASEAPASPARETKMLPADQREALRALLDQMDAELQAGGLAHAQETEKKINALLGGASPPGSLERRLKRGRQQLARLRDWARWGNDQAREQLIAAAEELLQGEPDVEALGASVPELREAWKRSDAVRPATKDQWERFDAALTKAFQPVIEYRAKRAAEEQAAAAAKTALCEEYATLAAGIDWERPDYRAIDALQSEMARRWRIARFAGFREERRLRKRFDELAKLLDDRLHAARQGEVSRREEIIREAEALCDAANLGEAVRCVIALQGRWQSGQAGARLGRKDEQALWQRFRRACDAVFSRRDADRAEAQARRDRQSGAREALLAGLQSALAGRDAEGLARALADFRRGWSTEKGERNDRLEARSRDLLRQAQRRIEALRTEMRRQRFERLAQRSALVEALEVAAARGDTALQERLAEAQQAWRELARLPANEEKLMQGRLEAALRADAALLERGTAERESWLLDLEMALDLPSPEHASRERRERQLLRLRDRFRRTEAAAQDPESMVLRWYATAAASDPEHQARMAAIVAAIVGHRD